MSINGSRLFDSMKNVVAINTANSGGGAEKVGYTLVRELHERGYHSRMLARRIDYNDDPLTKELVIPVPGTDKQYAAGNYLDEHLSTQYLFYLPTFRIPYMDVVKQADVIHFHNLHGNYFNLFAIPLMTARKPVVWTFHDMWAFTGKCAWTFDCSRYTESCGDCPQLGYYPPLKRDTSSFHLHLKKLLYGRPSYVIVTPSEWLRGHVEKSILKNVPVHVIPSPVDPKYYHPQDKNYSRDQLGIPRDKKVVMFIASWINTIPHKGVDAFKEMLAYLHERRDDVYTLVVGHLQNKSVLGEKYAGKETGWVSDPAVLRACYTAADVFVSPTLAENSSCTIMEAMACGTPTVAYATGGIPEQIVTGETGFLVPPGDRVALSQAVNSLLGDEDKTHHFSRAAAERAVRNFIMDIFVRKYLKAYEEAVRLK
jgi:glycosyltransferase involved in cell wall biosynthesis